MPYVGWGEMSTFGEFATIANNDGKGGDDGSTLEFECIK